MSEAWARHVQVAGLVHGTPMTLEISLLFTGQLELHPEGLRCLLCRVPKAEMLKIWIAQHELPPLMFCTLARSSCVRDNQQHTVATALERKATAVLSMFM